MRNNYKNIRYNFMKFLFVLLAFLGMGVSISAQVSDPKMVILENRQPTEKDVLNALNGGGLTLSNPKIVAGNRQQMVIFSGGLEAGLGMDKGVLFATGNASEHLWNKNKEVDYRSTFNESMFRDSDLESIYERANSDVVVYTFDVTLDKHTTALRVAYQFGSEEYPSYVGTKFNDAFGFFVTGPGIKGTENIARLPTNQNVISVNSVNYGVLGNASKDEELPNVVYDLGQSSMYINNGHDIELYGGNKLGNWNNSQPKVVFIEYNGLTKLITYDLTGLQGGQTYQFKIAIADSGDIAYDSGVIIQKIQGTTGADVKIVKEVDKAEVAPGEVVEFTLTATNLGPYTGRDVKVEDLLPNGYAFMSATPSKGKYDEKTGVWTIGDLKEIHEIQTLTIKAKLNSFGNYTNVAKISSSDPDPDLENNTDEVTPKVNNGGGEFNCFSDVNGVGFKWDVAPSDPAYKDVNQPASDGGFVFDVYQLDNSFNMTINGKQLYKEELEFQSNDSKRNVRFKKSQKTFGENGAQDIWIVNTEKGYETDVNDRTKNPTPAIRVVIDKDGFVSLFGKKTTTSELEELEVFDISSKKTVPLHKVDWIKVGTGNDINKVRITQNVIGPTKMHGFGYGQKIKTCETCTVEKDGLLKAANADNVKPGEVITYTFEVKNLGDMDIHNVEIVDPLFGFNITLDPKTNTPVPTYVTMVGDTNKNGILDKTETWKFTVDYKVTNTDIYKNKGVYNRATVNGVGKNNASSMPITKESVDPTPYKSGDLGWDPLRPYHTFVGLKGQSLFISNPHIYQKVK